MKPTTRYWKEKDLELLRNLKTKARKQAWTLKKDGYIVDFCDRFKNRGWGKLHYSEIYNYEKIIVFEFDGNKWNMIVKDMSYSTLTRFYQLVQIYKKEYGKKQLHKYTNEILKESTQTVATEKQIEKKK